MAAAVFLLLHRHALDLAPFLVQHLTPARVARLARLERGDAVGAEMAEPLAQLAPGSDDAGAVEEAEREGPDRPLRLAPVLVAIGKGALALAAARVADRRQLGVARRLLLRRRPAEADEERRRIE